MIDLHIHSTASDGSLTPAEVVRHAKEAGLEAIALTDHDTTDGLDEALAEGRRIGLEIVPGIEFSVKSDTETHILGYDIDYKQDFFIEALQNIRRVRRERNRETEVLLRNHGFYVTYEEALSHAPEGVVGRAHFARVMVEKGYVNSVKEAFDQYLSSGRPCFSSLQMMTAADAVHLIKRAGGYAFVAHLHLIRKSLPSLYSFIGELKEEGLDGIEGYYTDYTEEDNQNYRKLAAAFNLKLSGGTDFHGAMKPHIAIGRGLGNLDIPYSVLQNIRA